MDVIVQRLTLQGVDARSYPITSVAKHVQKSCSKCGAVHWDSRPNWTDEKPESIVLATDSPWEFTDYSAAKKRV